MMRKLNSAQPIIKHLAQHTILVDRFLRDEDRKQAMLVIKHLIRSRHLSEWHHDSGLRYWTLFSAKPLSDRSLACAFGRLSFWQENNARSAISSDDIRNYFPQLFRHGLPKGYFVEQFQKQARLGYAKVDSCSRISRIVSRTLRIIDQHRSRSAFRELIDQEQFAITWIVATVAKQRRLIKAFRFIQASGIRLEVQVNTDLLDIIAPIPTPIKHPNHFPLWI